jgi:hypothetical protein
MWEVPLCYFGVESLMTMRDDAKQPQFPGRNDGTTQKPQRYTH